MKKNLLLIALVHLSISAFSQNLIWSEVAGGITDQFIEDMTTDDDNNIFVTGAINGTTVFGEGENAVTLTSSTPDIFIACYHEGELSWAKQVGASAASSGLSIESDGNENLIVTGAMSGNATIPTVNGDVLLESIGSYDMFVAMMNEDGEFLWARSFGGLGADELTDIAYDGNTFYTCGSLMDWADLTATDDVNSIITAGGYDGVVLKFDLQGNCLAANTLGGAAFDRALTIAQQDNGNMLVAGHFREQAIMNVMDAPTLFTSCGGSDIFLASLSSTCEISWVKTFGTLEHDEAFAGASDGSIYLAGKLEGTMDMDPGPSEYLLTSGADVEDMFLCKLNDDGDFIWAVHAETTNEIVVRDIYVPEDTNIYISGYFKGNANFDPNDNDVIVTSANQYADPFMCNYLEDGSLNWAYSIQGDGSDYGNAILPAEDGVCLGGSFSDSIDLDPNIGLEAHDSPDLGSDLFIIMLSYTAEPINTDEFIHVEPSLFPNPTSGVVNLNHLAPGVNTIEVFDAMGKLCVSEKINPVRNSIQIILPEAAGIYHLQMRDADGNLYSKKVVKQ